MIIAEKVIEKEFESSTIKEAYLQCCKWVSTNIVAVNNSRNVMYQIEKTKKGMWRGAVKLTVYVFTDEGEVQEHNCSICKEVTGSFFMKQNKYMCEVCKIIPYRVRMKEKLKTIKEGLKGIIV